jgi:hypothetical protein
MCISTGLVAVRQSIWQNYWYSQEEVVIKAVTSWPPNRSPLSAELLTVIWDARECTVLALKNFKLECTVLALKNFKLEY